MLFAIVEAIFAIWGALVALFLLLLALFDWIAMRRLRREYPL